MIQDEKRRTQIAIFFTSKKRKRKMMSDERGEDRVQEKEGGREGGGRGGREGREGVDMTTECMPRDERRRERVG